MKEYYTINFNNLHVTNYVLGDGIDDDFNKVKVLKEIKMSDKTDTELKVSDIAEACTIAKSLNGYVVRVTKNENKKNNYEVIKSYEKR